MKKTTILLTILLLITATGCSSKNAEGDTSRGEASTVKSYQEEEIALPFEGEDEKVVNLTKDPSGNILIYTVDTNSKKGIAYQMQEDKSFQRKELPVLDSYLKEASSPWTASIGEDGAVYFIYYDAGYYPHVLRMKEDNVEELAVENIQKYMGGDSPDYPASIQGQADGAFLLSYMGALAEQYDSTGKVIREYQLCSGDTNIRNDVTAIGNTLITLNQEQNGFVLYDLETGKEKSQITASKTQWKLLRAGLENDFYYMDEKGVHHVPIDGKLTETIIDASDMPALLEDKSAYSFEMGKDNSSYVLYKDTSGNCSLKYYHYASTQNDAGQPQAQSKSLRIIGLSQSNTLMRAVNEFEKQHPDIKVDFQSYGEQVRQGSLSETIRIMNTEILSGKSGPDLILLDNLPAKSYIEKGALADLTELYREFQGDNALLESLAPKDGEKVYSIPARFSVPVLYGTEHAMEQISSIRKINEFLKNPGDTPLFENIISQVLSECLLLLHYNEITANLPDEQAIKEYMDAVAGLAEYVNASDEDVEMPEGYEEMYLLSLGTASCLGRDLAAVTEVKTIWNLAEPAAFAEQYDQKYGLIDGLYIPYDSIGINAMSENQEAAKDFLRILFSYDMQNIDMGEGFPVNKKAFEAIHAVESEEEFSTGWEENGEKITMTFGSPGESQVETFKEMVKGIQKPLQIDLTVKETLLESVKRVYSGQATSEEAAKDAYQKLKLYLSE